METTPTRSLELDRDSAKNRLAAWLLRSPVSGALDGAVMLITVRGRRTGREYTLPVQYAAEGDAIWVLPGRPATKTWWRNLRGEAPVRLRLGGHSLDATAQAFEGTEEPAVVEEGVRAYLGRFPAAARSFGVHRNDDDAIREAAKRAVMVRIEAAAEALARAVPPAALVRGTGVRTAVRRHPLFAYFALVYAFSWGYWIPDALSGGHVSHFPGLLGPMLAAFVVTAAVEGGPGVRDLVARMGRWRIPLRWYAAAVVPLAVALLAAAVLAIFGEDFPTLDRFATMKGIPNAGILATFGLVLLVNAYGEETGWRGFATPRLRERHTLVGASLILSLFWALWHVPTFFLDTGYRGFPAFMFPGFFLGIFAGAVVLTWLYEASGRSVLIVALWHAFLNMASATDAGEGIIAAIVTVAVIVWSIGITNRVHATDQIRSD